VKLEIGPREHPMGKSWTCLDVKRRPGVTHIGQWGAGPLPFRANTFDLIYASHVLEHIPWYNTVKALEETLRVLKLGGVLEVWVPDLGVIISAYQQRRCGDNWRRYNQEGDFMSWVNGRLFAYGSPENWHRAMFDAESLTQVFQRAGFIDIALLTTPRGYDHGVINLGLMGRKHRR